jgi:uncharacterized protein (TIGR02599 family)
MVKLPPFLAPRRGFTLVELLVSLAIIMILALVLFGVTNSISKIWKGTNSKIASFEAARAAFESMTATLNQATTHTYWDYLDANGAPAAGTANITQYGRNSELHFIAGGAAKVIKENRAWSGDVGTAVRPTHSLFFMVPAGYSEPGAGDDTRGLDALLNACGYYVEFNSDKLDRPAFMAGDSGNVRYRYRLMQLTQPAERLAIYDPAGTADKGYTAYTKWFNDALAVPPRGAPSANRPDARPIADNIIALIIQPRRSPAESSVLLAPEYAYDSRNSGTGGVYSSTPADTRKLHRHQLPPFVQVTMVALDETSAVRLAKGNQAPDLVSTSAVGGGFSGFTDAAKFQEDLALLEKSLSEKGLVYRVFTTNVHIRGAKWSEN